MTKGLTLSQPSFLFFLSNLPTLKNTLISLYLAQILGMPHTFFVTAFLFLFIFFFFFLLAFSVLALDFKQQTKISSNIF
jgi:hypothetical protein